MHHLAFILSFDTSGLATWSLIIDKMLLDFDIIDVVLWFPRLSWAELGQAVAAVLVCKIATDQIEAWALTPIKSRLKNRFSNRWPALAGKLGWKV